MSILKIAKMGSDVLKQESKAVVDPVDEGIEQLAHDMKNTLEDIGGNGLAAPQVHVPKRVVVYRIAEHQIPSSSRMKPLDWRTLINPVIKPLTDEKKPIWERCLSIPGLHGQVPRYTKVRLQAMGLDRSNFEFTATGFHAMILQHECDHLDGILYPMRMNDLSTLAFNSEIGDKGFLVPREPEEFSE